MEKNQVIDFGSGSTPFGSIQKLEDKVPENPVTPENKEGTEPSSEDSKVQEPENSMEQKDTVPTQDPPSTEPQDKEQEEPKAEDKSAEESQEEKKPNVYRAFADVLKQDGLLPEDLEVPENADSTFIGNTLREITEHQVRESVVQQVAQELENQGIRDHHLNMVMMLENGHDPSTISHMGRVEKYSSLSVEDIAESDSYEETMDEVIKSMYELKGFDKKDVDRMLKAIDSETEKEKIFAEEAVPFHKQTYEQIVQQERQAAQERAQYEMQKRQHDKQIVENIFSTRQVKDDKLDEKSSQELQKAILTMDQVVQTPDGQQHPTTEFQKFLYEFQTDLEMQIYLFKKLKFQDFNEAKKTDEIRKKVEQELEAGMRSVVENPGDPEKQIEEQRKIQEIQRPGSQQSMIVDFSNL